MTLDEVATLPISQLVEHPIDALHSRALLTPEMVIRRFPAPVTARADESPAVAPALDFDSYLRHRRSEMTEGGTKMVIHTRMVKVKVTSSRPRPRQIGDSTGESKALSRAMRTVAATCIKAAGRRRYHVSSSDTGRRSGAGRQDSFFEPARRGCRCYQWLSHPPHLNLLH